MGLYWIKIYLAKIFKISIKKFVYNNITMILINNPVKNVTKDV